MISSMNLHTTDRNTSDRYDESPANAALFDRFARHYDGDYRDYDDDIDLILALAAECDGPVLEMGCGTGRVALPLAAAGFRVVGVDISSKLLAVARAKLTVQGLGQQVELVQDELTRFDYPQKDFSLAVCTSNTLMHLTSAHAQMLALENACRHLTEGGLLLLDLFNPDVARLIAVQGIMELADEWDDESLGVHVMKWSVRTVDFAEQLQDTLFIYEEIAADGQTRRTVCPFLLRFLWRSEAELMLQASGFTVEDVWGDFDGDPYGENSEHLILLARKRGPRAEE